MTTETLRTVAALNADLAQRRWCFATTGDRSWRAACMCMREPITGRISGRLSAEQFIAAREFASRLSGFGEDAIPGYPFSGMRLPPDELFGIQKNYLIGADSGVQAGLTPLVPLFGLYSLQLDLSMADSGSGPVY